MLPFFKNHLACDIIITVKYMKKKTKILISSILVIAIISSVFAGLGFRAYAAKASGDSGPLKWALTEDGVFTVNGVGYGDNYSIKLTDNNFCPWTLYRNSIKTIIIEEGVQAIGDYWFYKCSNAVSVELPESLVKIGASCFYGCSSLPSITIPSGCTEYYDNTFNGCSSLKWAVLPEDNTVSSSLHTIPDNTFYKCSSLENVWVGEKYTSIEGNAFDECGSLKSLIWSGNSITYMGDDLPNNASIIGNSNICSWCKLNNKNSITISGSCGSNLSYSYDLKSKSLNLSGSGEMTSSPWNNWRYFIYDVDFAEASSIGENAFKGCEYLGEEITLPETVSSVKTGAFNGVGAECFIIEADSINIESSAFGGADNLVFYGKRGSGAYSYVLSERGNYPDWDYYCLGSHYYGQSGKCVYCDKQHNVSVLEPCGEHNYIYQYRTGNKLYYKCSLCNDADYEVNARNLLLDFEGAMSDKNTPFNQSNYDGRFDVFRDGYVNAKDYALISKIVQGKETKFDMTLSNENATKRAKELYSYICDTYGNKIISGQQELPRGNNTEQELEYVYSKTGKYPAIRGFDFMNDDFSGVVSRAEDWADRGGIVSICWHCSSAFDKSYDECKADEFTTEQWDRVLTEGTTENAEFIAGMDKAANALKQLQDKNIPVLWRPFHEFDGGWFWWGKGGSEYFKRLWIMMYNHFTYDKGLSNLIWVLGYSNRGTTYGDKLEDWYPGSRYCDVVGADSYEVSQNGAEGRLFNPVYGVVGDSKPIAMHETGLIPNTDQLQSVPWTWFLTWHSEYLERNWDERLYEVYNSDYVITLDELPDIYG